MFARGDDGCDFVLELLGRGAERPAIVKQRVTLAKRGPRRKAFVQRIR